MTLLDPHFLFNRYSSALALINPVLSEFWFRTLLDLTNISDEEKEQIYITLCAFNTAEATLILSMLQSDQELPIKPSSILYPVYERSIPESAENFDIYKDFTLERNILAENNFHAEVQYDANRNKFVLFSNISESEFFVLMSRVGVKYGEGLYKFIEELVTLPVAKELYPDLYESKSYA